MRSRWLIAATVAVLLAVPVGASAHPLESNLGVFSGQFPEINVVEAEVGRDFFRDSVEAEYVKTDNIGFVGYSARPAAGNLSLANSDIAFQGKRAYQGTFPGFRIIDISNASKPKEIINYQDCRHPSGPGRHRHLRRHHDPLLGLGVLRRHARRRLAVRRHARPGRGGGSARLRRERPRGARRREVHRPAMRLAHRVGGPRSGQ